MTSNDVPEPAVLPPGTEVEVRTRYDGRWAAGFDVATMNHDDCLVRRRSDGAVLPVPIRVADVRPR